ncbi:MAG: ABC transporter permease [Candidatus Omnitrophica bacterium]|nr:ABC transporter permease [Candidatus Omnitrophota bacterium]
MFDRIFSLLRKEFLQVLRDPRMKTVIFISPLVQLLIFGYAATMDITNIPTAVYDLDNTNISREVIREFSYSKYFNIKHYLRNDKDIKDVINKADVLAVLKFNRGFGRDIMGKRSAPLQLILDGTDSNASQIILGYAGQVISTYNYRAMRQLAEVYIRKIDICPQIELRDRSWFNENLISRNYFLPGVMCSIISIMSILLSAMAIVREKEIGTMEQLMVSPIKSIELIIGKIVPFMVIAFIQVTLITLIIYFWFRVPMRGSITLLVFSTAVYLFTTLGIGIFLSTLSSTQQEAMMSVFLIYSPMFLLSGFAYPIRNMPVIIQYITYLNPMRYYLVIIRSIFLKGVGLAVLWDEILALAIIGAVVITLSTMKFQKTLA